MKKNIILTGFMGTGKTLIGNIVADKLNMEFIDTDKVIEEREKDRIARIFQVKGEEYFRKLEEKVINEICKKENCVIATGGGAIIREKNYNNMKKSGIIICLEAEPSIILLRTSTTEDRPLLLKNKDAISTIRYLINSRKKYYDKADYKIDTTSLSPEQAGEKIIEIWKKENEKNRN
ncbi:MAG TPA: shikimate kinase [bacterium]|nr:shikimate kinase [bacterium]